MRGAVPRRTTDPRWLVEERLEHSRSLHRIAGEVGRIGGWALDVRARELTWSDEVFALLEYPADADAEVDALATCRHGDDERLAAAVERCATEGTPFDLEIDVTTRTGRPLRARVVAEAQRDASGEIHQVIGAFQDISELRAAHEAARDAGERLALTLDRVSDGLCVLSHELEVTYVNERAARILRTPSERLIGRRLGDAAGVRWPELIEACRKAVDDNRTVVLDEVELAALAIWLEVRVDPTNHGVAVSLHDVTERRTAREALRRREIELADQAALLDEATDAILVRDLDHRITYANRSAERLYGWSADELRGRCVRELLHPDDPTAFDTAYRRLLQDDAWAGPLTPVTRDGEQVTIDARWTLMRDPGGAPRAVLAIATDVTERRRMEQQLIGAQRLQAVGTLAGGLAHDLRNVLTPVLMSLELLREGEHDPFRLELLETVERNTRRGTDIVAQVLTFARGVDGERVEVSVEPLLHELARLVQQTFPPHIELRSITSPGVRPVRGDPTQIHQVLVNLLLNARDAMPDGGLIEIRVSDVEVEEHQVAADGLAPGSYVRIEVADSGAGMSSSVIERAFDPFFTTKPSGDGTGLGLSTAHAIVSSHGGNITVRSRSGHGATFTLHLPAAEAARAPAPAPTDAVASGGGEVILLVDDEPLVRRLIKRTLQRGGYHVLEAEDGERALTVFDEADRVDLLVTDLLMPHIGGRELAERMRTAAPDLPVVVTSGLPPTNAGAEVADSVWLAKPFSPSDLLRQVRVALGDPAGADRDDDQDGPAGATRR